MTTTKNITNMTAEEKKNHMAKILAKMASNVKHTITDVTPKGYGVE